MALAMGADSSLPPAAMKLPLLRLPRSPVRDFRPRCSERRRPGRPRTRYGSPPEVRLHWHSIWSVRREILQPRSQLWAARPQRTPGSDGFDDGAPCRSTICRSWAWAWRSSATSCIREPHCRRSSHWCAPTFWICQPSARSLSRWQPSREAMIAARAAVQRRSRVVVNP